MSIKTLKDIYIDHLQDMYSANRQAIDITGKMANAATDTELEKALKDAVVGIGDGMSTLEEIINEHGKNPTDEHCKGMEGLVKEAKAHALEVDFENDDVRDAAIIPQYQRMVHYALAGYGTVVAFANRLGLDGDAARLQEALNDTYDGDRRMTDIATSGINCEAVAA